MILKCFLKISELEATALRMKLLIIFITKFKSTVWAARCDRIIEWKKLRDIDARSKRNHQSINHHPSVASLRSGRRLSDLGRLPAPTIDDS